MQGERVKDVRKDQNMTLEEFGKRLNVTKVTMSNIERGHRGLTDRMLKDICREFNVNEDWLRSGTGKMYVELSRDEQIEKFVGELLGKEEDSFKRRLISGLATLDENGWNFLENFLDSIQIKKD